MENRGEKQLAPLRPVERSRNDASSYKCCSLAAEESDAEPNAVRRLAQLRTPSNAPLAAIDGLYEALDQLADVVDEWLMREGGE